MEKDTSDELIAQRLKLIRYNHISDVGYQTFCIKDRPNHNNLVICVTISILQFQTIVLKLHSLFYDDQAILVGVLKCVQAYVTIWFLWSQNISLETSRRAASAQSTKVASRASAHQTLTAFINWLEEVNVSKRQDNGKKCRNLKKYNLALCVYDPKTLYLLVLFLNADYTTRIRNWAYQIVSSRNWITFCSPTVNKKKLTTIIGLQRFM